MPDHTTLEPARPRDGWQETVRSWGRAPIEYPHACQVDWPRGSACGTCWRCGSSPHRPPDGAILERIEEAPCKADGRS